ALLQSAGAADLAGRGVVRAGRLRLPQRSPAAHRRTTWLQGALARRRAGRMRSNRLLFLLPLLTLAAMAIFFGWALMSGRDPASIGSVMVGRPAPKLEGVTFGDGKPKLVNYFASWCAPCLAEHPLFTRLKQRDGAAIVGVAWKDKPEATRAWLAKLGDPFNQLLFDQEGKTALDWGLSGVPETYLVDGQGIVRLHFRGPITEQDLTQRILPLLKGGS